MFAKTTSTREFVFEIASEEMQQNGDYANVIDMYVKNIMEKPDYNALPDVHQAEKELLQKKELPRDVPITNALDTAVPNFGKIRDLISAEKDAMEKVNTASSDVSEKVSF